MYLIAKKILFSKAIGLSARLCQTRADFLSSVKLSFVDPPLNISIGPEISN